jgi:hypothetical protein
VWSFIVLKALAISSLFTATRQSFGSSVASFILFLKYGRFLCILFLDYCRLHSSALSHSDAPASALDAFR